MRILTFDIEDWFHILDNQATRTAAEWETFPSRIAENVGRILDLLAAHEQKATFFILGWVARKHPALVRRIAEAGHEIGSHSDMHQLVYEQGWSAFRDDLARSIDSLEQTAGRRIAMYRAPGFSIKPGCKWAFEELARAGVEIDCSLFPAARAHGGFPTLENAAPLTIETPSGRLKELPMSMYRRGRVRFPYSGGGYFRLLPYPALRVLFESQPYVMTYFHPRDFDPDQPVAPGLSAARRLKSYVGLAGALGKLDRLLTLLDFIDVAAALDRVDWAAAPRLDFRGAAAASAG